MERSCKGCKYNLGGGYNNCRINLENECAAGDYEAWEPDMNELDSELVPVVRTGGEAGITDRIQSCIDHIKSAIDVDPWAAELAEKALRQYDEPRVMTLEELKTWDGPFLLEIITGALVWASYHGEYDQYGDILCRMVDADGEVDDRYQAMYRIKWRCWTSRPTDEQRKAVKWDA